MSGKNIRNTDEQLNLIGNSMLEKYMDKSVQAEQICEKKKKFDKKKISSLSDLTSIGMKNMGTGFAIDAKHHVWKIEKEGNDYNLIRMADEEKIYDKDKHDLCLYCNEPIFEDDPTEEEGKIHTKCYRSWMAEREGSETLKAASIEKTADGGAETNATVKKADIYSDAWNLNMDITERGMYLDELIEDDAELEYYANMPWEDLPEELRHEVFSIMKRYIGSVETSCTADSEPTTREEYIQKKTKEIYRDITSKGWELTTDDIIDEVLRAIEEDIERPLTDDESEIVQRVVVSGEPKNKASKNAEKQYIVERPEGEKKVTVTDETDYLMYLIDEEGQKYRVTKETFENQLETGKIREVSKTAAEKKKKPKLSLVEKKILSYCSQPRTSSHVVQLFPARGFNILATMEKLKKQGLLIEAANKWVTALDHLDFEPVWTINAKRKTAGDITKRFCEVCGIPAGVMSDAAWKERESLCEECLEQYLRYEEDERLKMHDEEHMDLDVSKKKISKEVEHKEEYSIGEEWDMMTEQNREVTLRSIGAMDISLAQETWSKIPAAVKKNLEGLRENAQTKFEEPKEPKKKKADEEEIMPDLSNYRDYGFEMGWDAAQSTDWTPGEIQQRNENDTIGEVIGMILENYQQYAGTIYYTDLGEYRDDILNEFEEGFSEGFYESVSELLKNIQEEK